MSRKIKWGIIGLGNIAGQFASDLKSVPDAELVAVASRSQMKSEDFGQKFNAPLRFGSYDKLIDSKDVEAVYIATPHHLHFELSKKCLEAGKAVLCEKPITTSPRQLEELIRVQKQTSSYLMEGMWTYFLPAIQQAKEWVDSGRIGKVLHLKAEFGFPAEFDPNGRLFNPELAGGAVFDIGIYPIAAACFFIGSNPQYITIHRHNAATGVDDDVHMTFDYGDQLATLHCSFRVRLDNQLRIFGERSTIEIPLFWQAHECLLKQDGEVVDHFKDPRETLGYNFEIQSVSQDLLSGKKASDIMPLEHSMDFQWLMQQVLSQK